jgi:5'-nucleotidase
MRILITNDDGINAEGLRELALALKEAGHDLFIAAPSENQSCVSHGLTLRRPLYADKLVLPGLEEYLTYSVTGTPADCVRLSIGNLGADPEVIVSGINHAPNLGTDAVYSGTVSAAIEGYMILVPSIAVSKDTFTADHMRDAAKYFAGLLPELIRFFDAGPGMLNVNIPSKPAELYKGIRVARTALQVYHLEYIESMDNDGRTCYSVRSEKLTECPENDDSDERMMRDGYVVVTPLTYDITEYRSFDRAKSMFERDY